MQSIEHWAHLCKTRLKLLRLSQEKTRLAEKQEALKEKREFLQAESVNNKDVENQIVGAERVQRKYRMELQRCSFTPAS